MNYNERIIKQFDYENINKQINNSIRKNKTNTLRIDLLYKPSIIYNYKNGWSTYKNTNKELTNIEPFAYSWLFLTFTHVHHIFSKDEYTGKIYWIITTKDNINDNNLYEVLKKLKELAKENGDENNNYILFNNNLESILKEIEEIINIYNINTSLLSDSYYSYFNKNECIHNAELKIKYTSIIEIEEQILDLANKVRNINKINDCISTNQNDSEFTQLDELKKEYINKINNLINIKNNI